MVAFKIPRQPFSGYGELLGSSWKTLWRKPKVFFPLIYLYVWFLVIISLMIASAEQVLGMGTLNAEIIVEHAGQLLGIGIIGGVVMLFLLFHVSALMLWVYQLAARGKRIAIGESWKQSWSVFWRVTRLMLASMLVVIPIMAIVVALTEAFAALAGMASTGPGFRAIALVMIGLLALAFFAVVIVLGAWFMFTSPLVVMTKRGIWNILGVAWRLLRQDRRHVWTTYLISLGISIAASIFLGIMLALITFVVTLGMTSQGMQGWNLIATIIRTIVNIILSAWISVFVFTSFLMRYKSQVK